EEVEEEVKGAGAKGAKKKRGGIKYGILIPAPLDPTEAEVEAEKAAKSEIPPDDPNYKATTKLTNLSNGCARGLKWLTANYRVNLSDNQFQTGQQWNAYYLYTIERLAALSGLAEINGHDWYVEGCDYLISKQTAEGFWDMDQAGADADTCFAIMFMVKATEKTLKKTPRKRRDPKLGGGVLVGARGLPDDLSKLQVGQSGVKVRKLKGAVDQLLGELEKLDSSQIEAAQEAIIDTILTEDPEALVGQQKRLQALSRDRRPEVRRTAVWALGRTNELSAIPFLLERLEDVDLTVIVESRNALRFMTRKPDFLELNESPTPEEIAEIVKQAKKWYLTVRPYGERDDLQELTEAKP
ncbi:MAG: HEAT repeat domain-containing protein, partial [Planctomycetota bacterium]|nr:HEAT repeat domain-containing protein [Planctomycetota bacterium]